MSDTPNIRSAEEITRAHRDRFGAASDDHREDLLASLTDASARHSNAMQALHREAGNAMLTASQQRQWDAHERACDELDAEVARLVADDLPQKLARAVARRAKWGSVRVSPWGGSSPWSDVTDLRTDTSAGWIARGHSVLEQPDSGLSVRASEMLAEAMAGHDGDKVAQFVVARSNPSYRSAFEKILRNPERGFTTFTPDESAAFSLLESCRAAMSTSTGVAGYTIPLALDGSLAAISSDGITNPYRRLGTVSTAISSPARTLKSSGVTAQWVAENTAFGDNSPTFEAVDIPMFKLSAWLFGSYEVLEDGGKAIGEALPLLIADARDVAEGTAFATGNGTTAPEGIQTGLVAVAGATVTATTRGTFTSASYGDLFNLINALPPRARQSASLAGFANNTQISTVRQMVVGTAGVPVVELDAKVPSPLGVPLYEASAMSAATTSGTTLMCVVDMSKYLIVDSAAGPSLQYVPVVFDQATGYPKGQAGWVYTQRTGAKLADPARGRYLKA